MEQPPPHRVPPGWQDDPNDPTTLSYWDGDQWTDQRVPKPTERKPTESMISQAFAWASTDFKNWTVAHYLLFGTLAVLATAAIITISISTN